MTLKTSSLVKPSSMIFVACGLGSVVRVAWCSSVNVFIVITSTVRNARSRESEPEHPAALRIAVQRNGVAAPLGSDQSSSFRSCRRLRRHSTARREAREETPRRPHVGTVLEPQLTAGELALFRRGCARVEDPDRRQRTDG